MAAMDGNAFCDKYHEELQKTAKAIASAGKGILAADESTGTIGKRLSSIGVANEEPNRRALRNLLFSAPDIEKYISGVILYEETLFQKLEDGTPLVKQLQDKSVHENAYGLARYAAICQENGLVPIVEPEILMDGSHDISTCAAVTERVIAACYKALSDHHVLLEGTLLKPNMVTPGVDGQKASPQEIGAATYKALTRVVPPAVPGVHFLSGGQSEEQASANLNAMNVIAGSNKPWARGARTTTKRARASPSGGRCSRSAPPSPASSACTRTHMASALKAWGGKAENEKAAQDAFLTRAKANSLATLGRLDSETANGTGESLYVKDYKY